MDDTSYFIKIPVIFAVLLMGFWGLRVILSARSRSEENTPFTPVTTPPPLPWDTPGNMKEHEERLRSQLPEAVPLPAWINGELRTKIESHLGDKLRDRNFMFDLRVELSRMQTLKEEELSVLEATLMGLVTGQTDLAHFFGALEQADVILLTCPEKNSVPLAIDHEDGNAYLAVFTDIEKAILAIDQHESYSRTGDMKILDVMDILFDQLGFEQLGLWINPYDRVLTFRFNPEQTRAFSKIVAAKREALARSGKIKISP